MAFWGRQVSISTFVKLAKPQLYINPLVRFAVCIEVITQPLWLLTTFCAPKHSAY